MRSTIFHQVKWSKTIETSEQQGTLINHLESGMNELEPRECKGFKVTWLVRGGLETQTVTPSFDFQCNELSTDPRAMG